MNTIREPLQSPSPERAFSHDGIVTTLAASVRDCAVLHYQAWKKARRDLREIDQLTDRDLVELGYSRAQLRAAVLGDIRTLH